MAEMHYTCTYDEARNLVKNLKEFWVSNCGCREVHEKQGKKCARSRMDVCLMFQDFGSGSGSGFKKISLQEMEAIFRLAKEKKLVTRPFRTGQEMKETGGICFCCDDCCAYFLDPGSKSDKGMFIEKTDMDKCTHCGDCVEVCYFQARKMENEKLVIDKDKCYGCGLCVDVCPDCIQMVKR